MLVLSRKASESIQIGDDIVVTIVRISSSEVRIGIDAPSHVPIIRRELEPQCRAAESGLRRRAVAHFSKC